MIKAYIYYPIPHVAINCNPDDPMITAHPDAGTRREMNINLENLGGQLSQFGHETVRFTSKAGLNGMWLNIDLGDREFEISVVNFITRKLGNTYIPFQKVIPKIHCE